MVYLNFTNIYIYIFDIPKRHCPRILLNSNITMLLCNDETLNDVMTLRLSWLCLNSLTMS